ncbi:hypothetical protein [Pseudodesulfovibrio indicus]|uniref:hypothetical protein n=1 Tax=Pseudodesulfovibrio indicus TaxID=1716143 RepID=UPI002930FB98|nr:hypothetical protein [Pseudodesulfovibrio indicus]
MRVTTKKEEVGFVPTSFTITVENLDELLQLFKSLERTPDDILDGLFEHVSKRLEEETERGVAK